MPSQVSVAELADDPHPHLRRWRAAGPVHWVAALESYVVVGYDEAVTVLRDPDTYTVDDVRFSTALVVGRSMLSTDGADHARYRQPFVAPLRRRAVTAAHGPAVTEHIADRVGAVAARSGRAELRTMLAGPVAAATMATTLGLDGADDRVVGALLGWYREIVASVAGVAESRPVTAAGAMAMRSLASALEASHRRASVLDIAASTLRGDEVVANAAVLLFGGIETTEAMILNALWFLLRDGAVAADGVDPDAAAAVAAIVEESLRLEPAAAVVDRYTTRPVALGGVDLPERAPVTVSLAGANRDPGVFAEPDRFDPARPDGRRHLAFATGPHVCLGMDLARLETVGTVAELVRRLPGLRLAAGSPAPTGLVFRKPDRLDVRW